VSLSNQIKRLDGQINLIQRRLNFSLLSKKENDNLSSLHQNLADARVYAQEFELAETDEDRQKNAVVAKRWLSASQKRIMLASQTNIFEPADVALLSAQIEQISASIK
jgi:hypothetical protein